MRLDFTVGCCPKCGAVIAMTIDSNEINRGSIDFDFMDLHQEWHHQEWHESLTDKKADEG
jgi:hypothetical protein